MPRPPTFSIVLPTRNRPRLVREAITTALAQSDRDLELIVSDNSSDGLTAEVVKTFSDPRIKYVATGGNLSMPDSWRFALSHATGEWVIVLEDDCALARSLLARLRAVFSRHDVDFVTWTWFGYYSSNFDEEARKNTYVVPSWSGQVHQIVARRGLEAMFAFDFDLTMPRMYNTCVRRSLVEEVERRVGHPCPAPAPDYTFCAAALALARAYAHIDLPLMLSGCDSSPGSSAAAFNTFLEELSEERRGGYAPIKLRTIHPCNIVAESMCKIRDQLPGEMAGVGFGTAGYLLLYDTLLRSFAERKFPVVTERKAFDDYVASLAPAERLRCKQLLWRARGRNAAMSVARRVALRHPKLVRLAEPLTKRRFVRGLDAGFADIVGAIDHLDAMLPRPDANLG